MTYLVPPLVIIGIVGISVGIHYGIEAPLLRLLRSSRRPSQMPDASPAKPR